MDKSKKEIYSFLNLKQIKEWNCYEKSELEQKWKWLKKTYKFIKVCKWDVSCIGEVAAFFAGICKKIVFHDLEDSFYVFLTYGRVCNVELLKMISEHICIINEKNQIFWQYVFANHYAELNFDEYEIIMERRYSNLWCDKNDVFLTFSKQRQEMGEKMLRCMGITREYVCFHTRDSRYNELFLGKEFEGYVIRNGEFEDYNESILYLKCKGIQAVRMGKRQKPLKKSVEYIDFVENYDDFLDLFLLSKCKFFVGDVSGLGTAAKLFGRPVLHVNSTVVSLGAGLIPNTVMDLLIRKKFYNTRTKTYLSLKQIMRYEEKYGDDGSIFLQRGIIAERNTSQEILDAVTEMYERVEGKWETNEEDTELQRRYLSILGKKEVNNKWRWGGSLMYQCGSRFLRENQYLLED